VLLILIESLNFKQTNENHPSVEPKPRECCDYIKQKISSYIILHNDVRIINYLQIYFLDDRKVEDDVKSLNGDDNFIQSFIKH